MLSVGMLTGSLYRVGKLSFLLERYSVILQDTSTWLVPTAQRLVTFALETAWDKGSGDTCFISPQIWGSAMATNIFWYRLNSLLLRRVLLSFLKTTTNGRGTK